MDKSNNQNKFKQVSKIFGSLTKIQIIALISVFVLAILATIFVFSLQDSEDKSSNSASTSKSQSETLPAITKDIPLEDFDQIEIQAPVKVNLEQAVANTLSVTGSQSMIENATIQVEGTKLLISGDNILNFDITIADLKSLSLSKGASITSKTLFCDSLEIDLEDSSEVIINDLRADNLAIDLVDESQLKILYGQTNTLDLKTKNQSQYNALEFGTREGLVTAEDESKIEIKALGTLDITNNSSESLTYKGGAEINSTGAGEVLEAE